MVAKKTKIHVDPSFFRIFEKYLGILVFEDADYDI